MRRPRDRSDRTETDRRVRALIAEHGRAVEDLLASVENDPPTREDLWSEVFTIAYCRIDQLTGLNQGQARGWLLRTARNVTANSARRTITHRKLRARLVNGPDTAEPSAEDAYFDGPGRPDESTAIAVKAAWSQLSETHQRVLALDASGHDGPRIAEELKITALAARARLLRARRAFLIAYEESGAARR